MDSLAPLNKFPFATTIAADMALAAIPARYAIERGRWDEAAQMSILETKFPAAQSVTYFTRALGAARSGNAAAAPAEVAHLDEIEAKLTAARDEYWAGQTRIQKQAATAWIMYAEGQRDAAISSMRQAADLDDASEKTVAMENKLLPIRTLLGELYLAAGLNKEALAEFEASDKVVPNHFRSIAGAAAAARGLGSSDTARRYYRQLTFLVVDIGNNRPEILEAKSYLTQN